MRAIPALLALLLFLGFAAADFRDLSLVVNISVNPDGSAHITEAATLSVGSSSQDLYENSILSRELTIQDWSNITGSSNIRQHILPPISATNIKIIPEKLTSYSFNVSTAVVELDYDVNGLFVINKTGPRKTTYTLNKSALSFDNSPSGPVLPKYTALVITLPPGMTVLGVYPPPDDMVGANNSASGQLQGVTELRWKGPVPMTDFEFAFLKEDPLDVEVNEFFNEAQKTVVQAVFSPEGALFASIVVILALLYLMLKRKE